MIILLVLVIYILWRDLYRRPAAIPATDLSPASVLDRAALPDRSRLRVLGITILGIYAISAAGLYLFWYSRTRRTGFHWFNDIDEWNQMDKAGHIFSGYFQSVWGYEVLRWAGLNNKQSAIGGAMLGLFFQNSIEVMDGFSTKWGASQSDLGANLIGATMAASQYLLWEEQRIMLKYSMENGEYSKGELAERAAELFGNGLPEAGIKDYNKMRIWASVNPSKFYPGVLPKWFCFSIGYGAENLYGGFQNVWEDKNGIQHDRRDLPRMRVLDFSLDADLPALSSGDKKELTAFKLLNIFKVPFPGIKHKWEAAKVSNPNPNGWGREE